MGVFDDHLGLL